MKTLKIAFILLLLTPLSLLALTFGNYEYSDNGDGTCIINDYYEDPLLGYETNPSVPATINGLTVTSLGEGCFFWSSIESITLPNSVISLGEDCFSHTSIESITLPNSVISLGKACFSYSSLESITLPNSVISLGEECFKESSLKSINIPDSVTSLGSNCFGQTGLTSITLPNSVASVGDYCFASCNAITNINLPNFLTNLSEGCFSDCINLTSILLPETMTSLGKDCFYDCDALLSLIIPASVDQVDDFFARSSAITNLLFQGNAPTVNLTNALPSECKIYYMQGKTGFATPTWQGYACAPLPEPAICGLLSLVFIFLFKRNYK